MGYQVYRVKKTTESGYRFGGYGVPAVCEYPDCNEEIDRGMSFACGDEPFSETGCDRYFCSKHKDNYKGFNGFNERCRHKNDCKCEFHFYCDRCAKGKNPFPYKPETKEWIEHVLTDESWEEWRKEEPEMVEEYKKLLSTPTLKD